jgi:hypothetical protein
MDSKIYACWLKAMLIADVPPNSILAIYSASSQNIQTDKPPTSNSKKDDLKAWLLERNIPFCDNMVKDKLYDLIKLNKPKHKCYVIDQISADKGHTVLRLQPYHPDLYIIEFIWAGVK